MTFGVAEFFVVEVGFVLGRMISRILLFYFLDASHSLPPPVVTIKLSLGINKYPLGCKSSLVEDHWSICISGQFSLLTILSDHQGDGLP